jgi:hypothetical protein
MSFSRKQMVLEIIVLRKINQAQKTNSTCSHSNIESRPLLQKIEHDCERGLFREMNQQDGRGGGKEERSNAIKVYFKYMYVHIRTYL